MAVKPSTISVTFWGTRGSISTPGSRTEKYGGNTSCVSVEYKDTDIIIDAGTGIRNLGIELAKRNKPLDLNLLLSHTHWDHIQGLPFFAPAYLSRTKLTIHGSPQKGVFLGSILSGQMDENYFPVTMRELGADISIKEVSRNVLKIGPFTVDWQEQALHPGGSMRYRLRTGKKKIVYASDIELDAVFSSRSKRNKELAQEYRDFIKGADLLIADGQYTKEQYPHKKGFGHTSIPLLVKTAYEQNVKQLAVFHHEPQNSDMLLDRLWSEYAPEYSARHPSMNIFWAREGMTVAV